MLRETATLLVFLMIALKKFVTNSILYHVLSSLKQDLVLNKRNAVTNTLNKPMRVLGGKNVRNS